MNVRPETIKLPEENIGCTVFDTGQSNIFFGYISSVKGNKSKNKEGSNKLKDFCTVKETVNKMRRPSIEWEKIFTNALSKYTKNSYQSTSKKETC